MHGDTKLPKSKSKQKLENKEAEKYDNKQKEE